LLLVRTALFLGCALGLMAQSDSAQDDAAPASSDEAYSGPAILSRGQTPGTQSAAPIAFRPYIGVSGNYTSGLVPVSVNSSGQIPLTDAYGVALTLGAYTHRTGKHTTITLGYTANFQHYPQDSHLDDTNQFLSLSLTHRLSRRLTFTLRNGAGTYSQNSFLPSTVGVLDTNYLQLPQNDIFDNRTIFLSTAADLIYNMTSRLSFNMGGEGDLTRRRSTALYGSTGASAHGDVQYRFGRNSILGADYRFTNFTYTRGFGSTDIHSVGLNYSAKVTRHVQLSMRIGCARVESLGLAQVQLDPAVAALLGESVSIQAAYSLHYVPDMSASLTDSFRHSQFGVTYTDGVSPGNGVYLASRSQSGGASYSYTGIHYWNFALNATYARMNAIVQTLGAYTSYGAGAGVTRELGKGLHAVLRLDASHYDVAGNSFLHTQYRASAGLSFSPGDKPLRLW
jgi:hypothetical protein